MGAIIALNETGLSSESKPKAVLMGFVIIINLQIGQLFLVGQKALVYHL
jgi:hypothetical protein